MTPSSISFRAQMAGSRHAGSVVQSGRSQDNINSENMMKTASKPADAMAEGIRFGVEIETVVPASAGLTIGAYHGGRAVVEATALDGRRVTAPVFGGHYWRAERDGSILADLGHVACEFVSPILHGEAGIHALRGGQRGGINQNDNGPGRESAPHRALSAPGRRCVTSRAPSAATGRSVAAPRRRAASARTASPPSPQVHHLRGHPTRAQPPGPADPPGRCGERVSRLRR